MIEHTDKQLLRQNLLEQRATLSPEQRFQWDTNIWHQTLDFLAETNIQLLGVYWPIRGEPDLHALYDALMDRHIRLALPVIENKQAPLLYCHWQPNDPIHKDRYGIATPITQHRCIPQAILVPCVGYTTTRYRLGYGGGFFDRTLHQHPDMIAIGIAYSFQETRFEIDTHDLPMHCVVTEKGILR